MLSPLGNLYLIADKNALITLNTFSCDLYKKATKTTTNKILNLTEKQLNEYFLSKRVQFNLPLNPIGTIFQKKAWEALIQIPYGKIWSYAEQANFLKNKKACRAVGSANGKNPIPIIIPCHRVIGSTGKLTGYSGGMEMKIKLLELEGHFVDKISQSVINSKEMVKKLI